MVLVGFISKSASKYHFIAALQCPPEEVRCNFDAEIEISATATVLEGEWAVSIHFRNMYRV